jgi:hypothetical protein
VPVEINSRGEGGSLVTGVSWHKGQNTLLKRRIATPAGNLHSSVTSPESGQRASVLCELRPKRTMVFYFEYARSDFPLLYKMFCV